MSREHHSVPGSVREMTSGGSANASWSSTSGTHTMEIRQAVTYLPVAKPHVVVGQIHDASDDVIVFRLEGSKLFVDENGEPGPDRQIPIGNGLHHEICRAQWRHRSTSGCYFKAGCYTQSNTDRGDSASAYGQVVIYNVTVTHQ
jgi:alginate lyase